MEGKRVYTQISLNLIKKILEKTEVIQLFIKEETEERNRVQNVLEKISQGNYFFVHYDLSKPIEFNDIMTYQNYQRQVFENDYVYNYEGFFKEFEIELIKFGKSIFGSTETRYALFHFPLGFYSSPTPVLKSIHLEDLRKASKDKTLFLINSKINKEFKTNFSQKDWILDNKAFRLSISPNENNDKPIYLYFDDETKVYEFNNR
jgi:hypothetical protein